MRNNTSKRRHRGRFENSREKEPAVFPLPHILRRRELFCSRRRIYIGSHSAASHRSFSLWSALILHLGLLADSEKKPPRGVFRFRAGGRKDERGGWFAFYCACCAQVDAHTQTPVCCTKLRSLHKFNKRRPLPQSHPLHVRRSPKPTRFRPTCKSSPFRAREFNSAVTIVGIKCISSTPWGQQKKNNMRWSHNWF